MPRTNVELTIQVGQDGTLDDCLFSRAFTQLNDSLARGTSGLYELAGGELNVAVDMGDISTARLLYLEADGDIELVLGGAVGTVATLLGSGGTFPTGFVGGEAFSFNVDGTAVAGTFDAADQTAQQVVNRLNATAMLAGLGFVPFTVEGGQIRVSGELATSVGEVEVVTANATIGFAATATDNGTDPAPGTSPVQVSRAADPLSSVIEDMPAFFLASVECTSIILSNPGSSTVNVRVVVVGDLVS